MSSPDRRPPLTYRDGHSTPLHCAACPSRQTHHHSLPRQNRSATTQETVDRITAIRIFAAEWKALDAEAKAPYYALAKEDKLRHQREYSAWLHTAAGGGGGGGRGGRGGAATERGASSEDSAGSSDDDAPPCRPNRSRRERGVLQKYCPQCQANVPEAHRWCTCGYDWAPRSGTGAATSSGEPSPS